MDIIIVNNLSKINKNNWIINLFILGIISISYLFYIIVQANNDEDSLDNPIDNDLSVIYDTPIESEKLPKGDSVLSFIPKMVNTKDSIESTFKRYKPI